MSILGRKLSELIPGILMFALVLVGVVSGATTSSQQVSGAQSPNVNTQLRDVAGTLAIQVLSGAGAVLSASVDLNDDLTLCRSNDRAVSSERQRRSF